MSLSTCLLDLYNACQRIGLSSNSGYLPTNKLHKELLNLTLIIKHQITSLTLALKNPDISCCPLVNNLIDSSHKLGFIADKLDPSNLWAWSLKTGYLFPLATSLENYAQLCRSQPRHEAIMEETGKVWQICDVVTQNAPDSAEKALHKTTANMLETLEDALAEVKALIVQAESATMDDSDDDALDSDEVKRATTVSMIVRMCRLLIKHVAQSQNTDWQKTHDTFKAACEATDDLVAASHPPQSVAELSETTADYVLQCQRLAKLPFDNTAQTLAKLSLDEKASADDEGQWREMCIRQIRKAAQTLLLEHNQLPPSPYD